jgi:hypothetical protein
MKTTIKQTTEVEVEIQLPYYFKNICHAYAIFDEQTSVMVNYGSTGGEAINNYSSYIALSISRSTDLDAIVITSSEFKDLYNEVLKNINAKLK